MLIKDVGCRAYLRYFTNSNAYTGVTTNEERLTSSRPVCGVNDKLFKFKGGYEVIIEGHDVEVLCDEKGYCTVEHFLDYISKNHLNGKKLRTFFSKNLINAKTLIKKRVLIVIDEEKEPVTNKTMRDLRYQAEQETIQTTSKIIDTFALENMKIIAAKYGLTMRPKDMCFRFEDEKAWNTFIINTLKETFFKEIEALGIMPAYEIEDRERALAPHSKILKISECKLKLSNTENKGE